MAGFLGLRVCKSSQGNWGKEEPRRVRDGTHQACSIVVAAGHMLEALLQGDPRGKGCILIAQQERVVGVHAGAVVVQLGRLSFQVLRPHHTI